MPFITIEKNWVQVVGIGWWGQPIAMEYPLRLSDIHSMKTETGDLPREAVSDWLASQGDFQTVNDFAAFITGYSELEQWQDPDSVHAWLDIMAPMEF